MGNGNVTTGVIEIRVRELAQLFNSLDPSPFVERDLDDDAEQYIVGWAREYPARASFSILIHLPAAEAAKAASIDLAGALSNYFAGRAETHARDLRELFRTGRLYLSVGLPVLVICLGASQFVRGTWGVGPVARAIEESFIIVGWVANWKPIETFLYDWLPLVRRQRLYRRLQNAVVEIVST